MIMVYDYTNLSYKSDIAALAQGQSTFDPLNGSSGHCIGFGMVEHVLTTWRVPLESKLQGHLE